jgi:hypothetical protein
VDIVSPAQRIAGKRVGAITSGNGNSRNDFESIPNGRGRPGKERFVRSECGSMRITLAIADPKGKDRHGAVEQRHNLVSGVKGKAGLIIYSREHWPKEIGSKTADMAVPPDRSLP